MKHEGKIFKTKKYGDLIVTKYVKCNEVSVRFISTGYETTAEMGDIRKGNVRDRLFPSIYGVGIIGEEPTRIDGVVLKEYMFWVNMLTRCLSSKYHDKHPTYKGCTFSENFKYYPYFKEWCSNQIGFGNEGWHLDKDILVKENKVYSEDTCVFVPREINNLLALNNSNRGEYLLGVCYSKQHNKFAAQLNKFGKKVKLGVFNTEQEAFNVYKKVKEDYTKEVANKWKDQIDPRVYDALMTYEVEMKEHGVIVEQLIDNG